MYPIVHTSYCSKSHMMQRQMTDLRVPQVRVPSKQDGDIVRCLSHPLHHHPQLFHPFLCVAFTALEVGRHQTQLLAFEIHLISKAKTLYRLNWIQTRDIKVFGQLSVHEPELQADSSSFEWWCKLQSRSPWIWLVTSSTSSQWSNHLHHLVSTN